MKKIMSILGALIVTVSVNAADINDKFYAGVTVGVTIPIYNSSFDDSLKYLGMNDEYKSSGNLGVAFGKGFGSWGLELNAMILNARKDIVYSVPANGTNLSGRIEQKLIDLMVGLDVYYNFIRNNRWTFRAIVGATGIKSSIDRTVNAYSFFQDTTGAPSSYSKSYGMKFGPKVGLGMQFAFNNSIALTASVNYVKPIDHAYLNSVVYSNVGFNFYI
jgi:opacity protein-like surface antigen